LAAWPYRAEAPLRRPAPPRPAPTNGVVALTPRLSLVTSGRTNVLALSTPDGFVVVDSGAPELTDNL
jgi:hypothetical protein